MGVSQGAQGNDKGSSGSLPRPQSSTELGSHPPSRIPNSGFFPLPIPRAPRRRTAGTANRRTQSVNFVFARHSQPMGAGFFEVPPSVLGAPCWRHTIGRHLPPSCVWQRSPLGVRLEPFWSFFSQNKLFSSTSGRDGDKKGVMQRSEAARASWVASSRHACRVRRHLECGVFSVFFSQSSAWFLKWLKFEGTPARTDTNGLRDRFLPVARVHIPTGAPRVWGKG